MISSTLIVFLSATLGIIILSGFVLSKMAGSPVSTDTKNAARSQLTSLAADLELPSYALATGISDQMDLQFVRSRAPKLENAFQKDRARLARLWLQENRNFLNRLMRLHRLIARGSANVSVDAELRVAITCVVLKTILLTAEILVLVAGPFKARHLGSFAMTMFDQLSSTVGSMVTTLDAAQKASIRADWARIA